MVYMQYVVGEFYRQSAGYHIGYQTVEVSSHNERNDYW